MITMLELIDGLTKHFSNVIDPGEPNVTHQLFDIITMIILEADSR